MSTLYISPTREDHLSLASIFRHFGWSLEVASTVREARRRLAGALPPVVICERDLPDGTWHVFLAEFQTVDLPPRLVVASGRADGRLWAEVLNLGGFDVLSTPFDRQEVQHVVSHAWESREREGAGRSWRYARPA